MAALLQVNPAHAVSDLNARSQRGAGPRGRSWPARSWRRRVTRTLLVCLRWRPWHISVGLSAGAGTLASMTAQPARPAGTGPHEVIHLGARVSTGLAGADRELGQQ